MASEGRKEVANLLRELRSQPRQVTTPTHCMPYFIDDMGFCPLPYGHDCEHQWTKDPFAFFERLASPEEARDGV